MKPNLGSGKTGVVPRHGVVTLYGYGITVRVDRNHLVAEDGIASDRRCKERSTFWDHSGWTVICGAGA